MTVEAPIRLPETPLVSRPEKTVADTLRAAARVIEEHGWCQDVAVDAEGRHCALGAVAEITGYEIGSPEYRSSFREARIALEMYLGVPTIGSVSWNDEPGRTEGEVLRALRGAASDWEASQ
jgi:hypothetical protein